MRQSSATSGVAFQNHLEFGTPTDARVQTLDRVEMAHLVLYAAASVALLAWRLIRRHGWEQRRQTQWIAFGLAGDEVFMTGSGVEQRDGVGLQCDGERRLLAQGDCHVAR